jgi:hypothetical protein
MIYSTDHMLYQVRRLLYLVLLLLVTSTDTKAQSMPAFFSPGIKLGYHFDRGFIFGLEASVSTWPGGGTSYFGLSMNIDWIGANLRKVHLGIEAGSIMFGAQYGPTLIKEKGHPDRWGSTLSCYTLMLAMPYVGYTWNMGSGGGTEIGVLGKYPIEINDDRMDIL